MAPSIDRRTWLGGLNRGEQVLTLGQIAFMSHYLLPYVPGSRLRCEVVTALAALCCWPLFRPRGARRTWHVLAVAMLAGAWMLARILASANLDWQQSLIVWINHSFFFSSACVCICWGRWLAPNMAGLLHALIWISVPVNLVAVFQWLAPLHPIHDTIFAHYGGTVSEGYVTDCATNAEFLVRSAGRYTSIFNGMHTLALFNVIVILFTVSLLTTTPLRTKRGTLAGILALAIAAGLLSASKSFYGGLLVGIGTMMFLGRRQWGWLIVLSLSAAAFIFLLLPVFAESSESPIASTVSLLLKGDLSQVLASRFDANQGFLAETVRAVIDTPSLMLAGAGMDTGNLVLADNAYLPLIVVGGLPLLLLTLFLIAMLVLENYREYVSGDPLGLCFLAMQMSLVAVGVGNPTYELGRITPMALTLNLAYLMRREIRAKSFLPDARHGAHGDAVPGGLGRGTPRRRTQRSPGNTRQSVSCPQDRTVATK